MTTPAYLRALAKRVCEEPPSEMFDSSIESELGWPDSPWTGKARPFTRSLDAAASLMPEGWRVYACCDFGEYEGSVWRSGLQRNDGAVIYSPDAPTEPQARTAAALLAMAVDMERDA